MSYITFLLNIGVKCRREKDICHGHYFILIDIHVRMKNNRLKLSEFLSLILLHL